MITTEEELLLRILFIISIGVLFSVRLYFHKKAGTLEEKTVSDNEGLLLGFLRILFIIPFFLSIFLFMLIPEMLYSFSLNFDFSSRIIGLFSVYFGVIIILWTNISLDRNFSTTLVVRADHKLITKGPYKYIRHPMYSGITFWIVGMLFVSDNWFFLIILPIYITLIMGFRMIKEEKMLESKFGVEYENYKKRTKRFIPLVI